ncbi:hypothetical protein QBC47DRAFT_460886 [Echria macrotheca]|uniref:PAS fold-4 domain-containing protein n=1 Tax=Echria macrotheca TaxID=438768 RepID=A0AAJ0BDP0_9PEZI|nr:hypothetical protein QBC47DRAFT_460886 [Echria macrotheca]
MPGHKRIEIDKPTVVVAACLGVVGTKSRNETHRALGRAENQYNVKHNVLAGCAPIAPGRDPNLRDHVAIYNEAYTTLAGSKHPHLMGMRYEDAWPEIRQDIAPIMKAAWHNGDATMKYDDLLFPTRGFFEETFFNWALIPLVGADGRVVAIFNHA